MKATVKGSPVVSRVRAKKLGIKTKTDILPAEKVTETFK
jgi:hypothetical protein